MHPARLILLIVFLALGGCTTYGPLVATDRNPFHRRVTPDDYDVLETALRYYIKDRKLTGGILGMESGDPEQLASLNSRLSGTGIKLLPASRLLVTPGATRRATPHGPDLWVLDICIVWKDGDNRTVRAWDFKTLEERDIRVIFLVKRPDGSWKVNDVDVDVIE